MFRRIALRALIACCATLFVSAPVASATTAGPLKLRNAYFRTTVSGVQTTTWTANHQPANRCDSPYTGHGSEKVKFASSRSVIVRAAQFGKARVFFLVGAKLAALPTRGYVERTGTLQITPVPGCEVGDGGGGGSPRPAPDCGRKAIRSLPLALDYDALNANRITLSNRDQITRPRFEQCPNMGVGWPTFLSRDDRQRTAGQRLPKNALYDRRQGKMLVIGRGTVRQNDAGVSSTTRITWTLTLVRLKSPRG